MKHTLPCLLWLLSAPPVSAAETPSSRPNVIVILVDDMGYGDMSCYDATALRTPNVDRLKGRYSAMRVARFNLSWIL